MGCFFGELRLLVVIQAWYAESLGHVYSKIVETYVIVFRTAEAQRIYRDQRKQKQEHDLAVAKKRAFIFEKLYEKSQQEVRFLTSQLEFYKVIAEKHFIVTSSMHLPK